MSNKLTNPVPVFFGFDERFAPYAYVSIYSMIQNANKNRNYHIHILHTDLSKETIKNFKSLSNSYTSIFIDNVEDDVKDIVKDLPVRDYYSVSTYFRIVIAKKFPEYDKAIYIDSDTAILDDVSKLYDINIGKKLVAAVPEAVMAHYKECGEYAEKVVGVKFKRYFNAGMIVINCKEWRNQNVLNKFVKLSSFYDFTIAQDQDYLNVICKDKVYYLPRKWNMECIHPWKISESKRGIIHYAFAPKPWHDASTPYADYFWKYALNTPYYMQIKKIFADYSVEQLEVEKNVAVQVIKGCIEEINKPDNFLKKLKTTNNKVKDDEGIIDDLLNPVGTILA